MQACVSAPPAAGASGILHPQPLLRHVPVRSGMAHPGPERPSTFLSLLEVSLPGIAGFLLSAWAAGPPETLSPKQTGRPVRTSLSSLPLGDPFSRPFFPSGSQTPRPSYQLLPSGIGGKSSCCMIHSCPQMETVQIVVNRGVGKGNAVCPCKGV